MAKRMTIVRHEDDGTQILGTGSVYDGIERVVEFKTLELSWKDNQSKVSCVPVGKYIVKKHLSPANGPCFELQDVPNRGHIQIHAGNYHTDILGCILVGGSHADINKDGFKDVTSSRIALKSLLAIMPEEFELTIV